MGSSHPTAQYKMFRPLFCVPLAIALVLLQQVPTASGTYALTLTTGATTLLSLTAAQSTALAAVGLLASRPSSLQLHSPGGEARGLLMMRRCPPLRPLPPLRLRTATRGSSALPALAKWRIPRCR